MEKNTSSYNLQASHLYNEWKEDGDEPKREVVQIGKMTHAACAHCLQRQGNNPDVSK